jgi:hypothetical protein
MVRGRSHAVHEPVDLPKKLPLGAEVPSPAAPSGAPARIRFSCKWQKRPVHQTCQHLETRRTDAGTRRMSLAPVPTPTLRAPSRPESEVCPRCDDDLARRDRRRERSSTRATSPRVAREDPPRRAQLYGKNEPVDAITLTNEPEQRATTAVVSACTSSPLSRRHDRPRERDPPWPDPRRGEIAQLGWEREPVESCARAEQLVSTSPSAARRAIRPQGHVETFQRISHLYEGAEVTGLASGFRTSTGSPAPSPNLRDRRPPVDGKERLRARDRNHVAVDLTPGAFFSLRCRGGGHSGHLLARVDAHHIRTGSSRRTTGRASLRRGQPESALTSTTPWRSACSSPRPRANAEAPRAEPRAQSTTSADDWPQRGEPSQEVSSISRGLKRRDLDLPVIALSQFQSLAGAAARQAAAASDLRVGLTEQDADLVMFPYREGVPRPRRD